MTSKYVPSVGRHWTAGRHWTVIPFPWKLTELVSITAMLQGVCDLDRSLKVSVPDLKNVLNVPQPSTFFFCLDDNFQTKKCVALRRSFNWKLISPNMPKDTQKHLFDLCLSHIFTALAVKIWGNLSKVSVSSHKISLCSKSPHFDGTTLNNFGCIYLTEKRMRNEAVVFTFGKEGLWWFKFVILEPMWLRESILCRKNIENCSMSPHLTVPKDQQLKLIVVIIKQHRRHQKLFKNLLGNHQNCQNLHH